MLPKTIFKIPLFTSFEEKSWNKHSFNTGYYYCKYNIRITIAYSRLIYKKYRKNILFVFFLFLFFSNSWPLFSSIEIFLEINQTKLKLINLIHWCKTTRLCDILCRNATSKEALGFSLYVRVHFLLVFCNGKIIFTSKKCFIF